MSNQNKTNNITLYSSFLFIRIYLNTDNFHNKKRNKLRSLLFCFFLIQESQFILLFTYTQSLADIITWMTSKFYSNISFSICYFFYSILFDDYLDYGYRKHEIKIKKKKKFFWIQFMESDAETCRDSSIEKYYCKK